MPLPRRRLVLVLAALAAVGLVAVVLAFVGGSYARGRVLPAAQEKLGRPVAAADISVGFGRVVLADVVVSGPADPPDAPLVRAPRVEVSFELLPALAGRVRVREIVVERARVTLRRYADGRDNFRDVVDHLRGRGGPGGPAGAARASVTLRQGALDAADEIRGVALRAGTLDAVLPPTGPARVTLGTVRAEAAGPAVAAERLTATVPRSALGPERTFPTVEVVGGSVAPLHSLALTGIRGTARPTGTPGRVAVDLRGGYGGVAEELWTATGEVVPAERRGALDITAARFTLDKLRPILKDTPIIEPAGTSIDASLKVTYADGALRFDGGLRVSGLSLFHPRLGPAPVKRLDALAQVRGAFMPGERHLKLDEAAVTFRNVRLFASGEAYQIGAKTARYEARLQVPPVPCDVALGALPEELTPALKGFRLAGTFKLDLRTKIDMADLDRTELQGEVGIRGCQVLEAPPQASKIAGGFTHRVEVGGREISFFVGPDNPSFVPYADISPAVYAALTTTEDGGFFHHRGFIPAGFRPALVRNLKQGAFSLGASTITMQMVKNALLGKEKTLARKLQELFLTWYVESRLTKERIMEVYLNVIEFGPFLYGIGPAARRYFGKPAATLTALEAAFFASILPSPKRRYVQYCKGALTPDWDKYVRRILAKMHERGRITDEEHEVYQVAELKFSRDEFPGEKECYGQIAAAKSTVGARRVPGLVDDDEPDVKPLEGAEGAKATLLPRRTRRLKVPGDDPGADTGDDTPPPPTKRVRRVKGTGARPAPGIEAIGDLPRRTIPEPEPVPPPRPVPPAKPIPPAKPATPPTPP
ncbi:MAG: transglycosylase domain-containing protein [Deltaproteobacteria bacterium]|nr:transglycosylase domain-containing protein [Deltaproteobacteria bacterium]